VTGVYHSVTTITSAAAARNNEPEQRAHPGVRGVVESTVVEADHVAAERRLLDRALRPAATVLDAGCGRTTRLRFYRDRIVRLVGVDADEAAGRANPYLDEFLPASLDAPLPFADGSFHLVYANFVVEHLADPRGALAEWRRVLAPDGSVVLVTSNRSSPFLALGSRLPQRLRLAVKRRGAGAAERDVYPTVYRANTPDALVAAATGAGLEVAALELVGTMHRYGARVPGAATVLRGLERLLPASRRSTIVARLTPHAGDVRDL
jgi:SAM-dependent methyltransferase